MTTAQTASPPEIPKPGLRTWKSTTAGILIIIAGIATVVAGIIHFTSGDLGIFAGVPWVES